MDNIQGIIEDAFEQRSNISPGNVDGDVKNAVDQAIEQLDNGSARVAEKQGDDWVVNEWLKKAVLLSFRIYDNEVIRDGYTNYYDKVPGKFADMNSQQLRESGVRIVPPAAVRKLQKDREFYDLLDQFDVITCDSQIMYFATKWLG
ncbi:MAG: hypothetical protein AAF512_12015, partial [Pseudomonadota bacterium]